MAEIRFTYVTYIFNTTPERVYRALTDRSDYDAYLGGTGPQSTWRAGDKVYWKSLPEDEFEDLDQVVLEAEPGHLLRYTWHRIQPTHRHLFTSETAYEAACGEQTEVSFAIAPAADPALGVRLELTHSGFDSPESKMLLSVSEGWAMILSALKSWLESEKSKN